MIRLTNNLGKVLLAGFIRWRLGEKFEDVSKLGSRVAELYNSRVINKDAYRSLLSSTDLGELPERISDIEEIVQEQLKSKANAGDLIGVLAEILMEGSGSSNVLGGKTLEQLRKAILRPDEYAEMTRNLRSRQMCCGSCGQIFISGEMLSFTAGFEGAGSNRLYCAKCSPPLMIRCNGDKCDKVVALTHKERGALQGEHLCAKHGKKTKRKESGESVEPVVAPEVAGVEQIDRAENPFWSSLALEPPARSMRPADFASFISAERRRILRDPGLTINHPTEDPDEPRNP